MLIAIPVFNEQDTIGDIVASVRNAWPSVDLLAVDDGSEDGTPRILEAANVITATHVCNLGYGRAVQTAIKYAERNGYDALITLDADGQHRPEQLQEFYRQFVEGNWDLLIGSRRLTKQQANGPASRRIGMSVFSLLVRVVTRQKIHDTSSGMKIIRRTVFEPLTMWPFIDFHAEAIVYLILQGYRIGEFPISVAKRTAGRSMYSYLSYVKYPLKTTLILLLGIIHARLARRNRK